MTDSPASAGFTAPSAPAPKKGFLGKAFNFVASAGIGAAVSITAKTACVAAFGTQFAALLPAAVLVGLASAGIQRGKDMYNWNKTHADAKVGMGDFFKASKTGNTAKDYWKRGALSGAFTVAGGLIGIGVSHCMHGASCVTPPEHAAPPVHTPEAVTPPPAPVPTPITTPSPDDIYTVARNDNLWNIVKEHYHLTSNADVQRFTDAVAVNNHLSAGTAANNLHVGAHLSLPSADTLTGHHALELDWRALDAQTAARHAAHHLAPKY